MRFDNRNESSKVEVGDPLEAGKAILKDSEVGSPAASKSRLKNAF